MRLRLYLWLDRLERHEAGMITLHEVLVHARVLTVEHVVRTVTHTCWHLRPPVWRVLELLALAWRFEDASRAG